MENLDDILFPETAHDSKIISLERHSETANFKPGDFIDHYQIISELGQGGMGIVYKAMDTFLNRIVALKIMLILNQSDQIALKRFQREAEICATLKHPYIVSVYTIGEYKSFPYIVMEYIEGIPINQYVQQNGENDWNLCATIIYKVAQALEYVHSNHIIHRDIKPSNILVRPNGDPVLMDFGIGKILYNQNKHNTLTKEGEILGTLFYSSPEQTRGQAVSEKTDIYSIGVILYQLLTKQCPFYAENTYILLRQISTIIPTPPCMINKSIPDKLQEVSLRCMEKNPKYRYSIEDLLSELHSFLSYINSDTVEPDSSNQTKSIEVSQTYKKVIWLRYYKASIFTALFILLICVSSVVLLSILSKIDFNTTQEIFHTIQLYTLKSNDLWKENSEKLLFTLSKEFGNMYKEKAIKSNDDYIKSKQYFTKAKKYYNTILNNDVQSFDSLVEIANNEVQLDMQFNKFNYNDNSLIEVLSTIQDYINNENWKKELYRKAGDVCLTLTQCYYSEIDKKEAQNYLKKYRKEAQNYLEEYVKKSPSDKLGTYAKLSFLEMYNDPTTILENISSIEQKVKTVEHSKETYWYYNNHFEEICKKILEEEKKYKNNFNQEHFDQYLTPYLYLCKNIELEKEKKDWKKFLRPFLYCAEIRPILDKRISILNDKINELSDETNQLNNKEENSQKIENLKHQILKHQFLLKEQDSLKIQCLLANFYITQDEKSTLQKIYQDEKIYNKLIKISLSKIEEPFFRFLAIFALVALPDENAHKLIEEIVSFHDNDNDNDDYKVQLASTYDLSKEDIDLEQAKLWVIILCEHLYKREKNFIKLLTKLSDEKKLSDEILLILFTHIDRKLLTIINLKDQVYNLTYDDLLKKNTLETLSIKIQQDDIYNFQYVNNNFETLRKAIKKILSNTQESSISNQNYQFFCLQFLKIYHEQLYYQQKKELENDINSQKYKNIQELLNNLKKFTGEMYNNDKLKNKIIEYARGNNGLQLQIPALFILRKSNPKEYEHVIHDILDNAKENNQSLSEDIQIDIVSYYIEQGKFTEISNFYKIFNISGNVLIHMLPIWQKKLSINRDSSVDEMELIKFLISLLKNPSKLPNNELRTSLLYLFACYSLEKFPLPLDTWRKKWLEAKDDIYTLIGTIFSFGKYPNNPSFNKKKIILRKKNEDETPEKQLIKIAKECIQGVRNYNAETLKAIAYSLVMLKAYYYINDISLKNPQEVKNEKILREKLEKLHQEIIGNIIDEKLKTKITEKLEKSLYYGIALGYSNILYNDFKYCQFEDFEIYKNFFRDTKDSFNHKKKHFYNQFITWSSNLYTERLPIIVYELKEVAKIEERNIIFEREFLKNNKIENKNYDSHVNNILRLKLNLQDYVQCLKQSIYCYKEAIKNEPRQELNDVVESILNNDFLLQRQLELGIIQIIIAEKMRASNENNRKILEEARQNIKEVQDAIKNYIFKQYQQLKDKNVKQKIVSFIQNNNPEDIVNSIIENNIAFFKPLIQDYYFCEKYLAFSYYVNKETEESNKRLEKCKKQNLWDYDIYKWFVEDKKIEPDPFLFDRLFLRDLNLTHF